MTANVHEQRYARFNKIKKHSEAVAQIKSVVIRQITAKFMSVEKRMERLRSEDLNFLGKVRLDVFRHFLERTLESCTGVDYKHKAARSGAKMAHKFFGIGKPPGFADKILELGLGRHFVNSVGFVNFFQRGNIYL